MGLSLSHDVSRFRRIVWFFTFALIAHAVPASAFEPTSSYREQVVRGFTLVISAEATKHEKELTEAVEEIEAQIDRAEKVVPAEAFAALQQVRIWVEWDNPRNKTAEFHPSKNWLIDNGYNPDKAGCVEIGHIVRFVKWSKQDQPWMVLHELAHAYHFKVLGEDNKDVRSAYRAAMKAGLYDKVDYVHGGEKRKAYAAGDEKEYFAELSEAYFGKNDFYPFNRDDLRKHDPEGFKMIEKVWGVKEGKE